MMYLLDTNVISELIKQVPDSNVTAWMNSISSNNFVLSVITIGEIRKGIEKLDSGAKKQKLLNWLEVDLANQFKNRLISIDLEVCDKWGHLSAKYSIPAIDGLIAATAMVHNLKLVTRNIKDFESIDNLEIINPWL